MNPFDHKGTSDQALRMRRMATLEGIFGVLLAVGLCLGLYLRVGSLWASGAAAISCAAVLGVRSRRRIDGYLAALDEVLEASQAVARGESFEGIDPARLGAFAEVGMGFNSLLSTMGGISTRVVQVLSQMEDLPSRASLTMREIQQSADRQEEAVEETAALLSSMKSSMRGVHERVENLIRAAEESSSSILEMGSSVDEVARTAASLHESAEASTSSVTEIGTAIRQVATAAEQVEIFAAETAASMVEMDRTLREVGEHVEGASSLTQEVSAGAESGAKAVTETIRDIELIHQRTSEARNGLEQLVSRISQVGKILDVIGEINDETKLLSLNAAIIAAQAGEQGRAFLVVANHVKDLARRTTTSTEEISTLIGAIQQDSDSAVESMGSGIEAIEQGVSRSRVAGEALQNILELSGLANARVGEISRAASQQIRTSGAVAEAAQSTSDQVRQISSAMAAQTQASDQVLESSQAALDLCRHVHRSTDEQRETGRYITESVNAISEMTRGIQASAEVHDAAAQEVSNAVNRLLENARGSGQKVPEVRDWLEQMSQSARNLSDELSQLRAPSEEEA